MCRHYGFGSGLSYVEHVRMESNLLITKELSLQGDCGLTDWTLPAVVIV
jgi:hypothetical protein